MGTWVEADDAGTPDYSTGLIDVVNDEVRLAAALSTDPQPSVSRVLDTTDFSDGQLELLFTQWSDSAVADDRLLVEVFAAGNPVPVTAEFAGGDGLAAGTGGTPQTVTVDIGALLPANEVTVRLSVTSSVDEVLNPAPLFSIDRIQAVLKVENPTVTDTFKYDSAGRMTERTVDGVKTLLTWDASSNLTQTVVKGLTVAKDVTTVYAYDAGGQRVAQVTLPHTGPAGTPVVGTATGYVAGGELADADTATTGGVASLTGTRFYTFAGATVAVRNSSGFFLLFGDEQGSAQIMMPVAIGAGGVMASATPADTANIQRTAYEPYGARRGDADLEVNRGWLGQTEDTGTGLTYLNARYYDPVVGRFLSPDPLMNPGDPRTLDPYRYADNNPISYTDATGLCNGCTFNEMRTVYGGGSSVYGKPKGTTPSPARSVVVGGQTYKIGSAPPPFVPTDDFGLYRTQSGGFGDWIGSIKWKTILFGGRILPHLDDGTAGYRHFWDNTGSPLVFDYPEAYREAGVIAEYVDAERARAQEAASALAEGRGDTTFIFNGTNSGIPNTGNENWDKAIGEHQIWSTAEVTVSGGIATMSLTVHASDWYNFNVGMHDIRSGLADSENARFEAIGWARGFPQSGSVTFTTTWRLETVPQAGTTVPGEATRDRGAWSEDRPDR